MIAIAAILLGCFVAILATIRAPKEAPDFRWAVCFLQGATLWFLGMMHI